QGDRSLEDHTRLFLMLANTTSYPDDTLCSFHDAICPMDNLARSTPEPRPPSPRCAELKPEPTDDGESIPAAINKPAQCRATKRRIDPEAPCARAGEGELIIHLGLLDFEGDLIDWETDLEANLPPFLSPFLDRERDSDTARIVSEYSQDCTRRTALRVRRLTNVHPLDSALACSPTAPPQLLAPLLPPSPVDPPAPPGSLITPAPPWPGTPLLRVSPCRSVPPALLDSSLPPAPPWSSLSRSWPPPQSPQPMAPPWPPGSSASPCLVGPLPPAPPPSVSPLELSALPPPWLLPLLAPPWVVIIAVAWVPPGPSCSKSLLSSPWLLPPSGPPWSLLSSPCILPSSSPPRTLCVVLLLDVRPPSKPPPKIPPMPPPLVFVVQGTRTRLPGGGQ
ncbi:hypothetical protein M9458_043086, partial [Cirrhinus mrigala]